MNQKERVQLEHNLYMTGLSLPCVGAILCMIGKIFPVKIFAIFYIPCILHTVTGLYCPGCGGTRAAAALLEGKIVLSFFYHPIVIYFAGLYLWFMISHTIEKLSGHKYRIGMHYRNLYLYLGLAVIIINIAVKDIALTAFGIDLLQMLDNAHALI